MHQHASLPCLCARPVALALMIMLLFVRENSVLPRETSYVFIRLLVKGQTMGDKRELLFFTNDLR